MDRVSFANRGHDHSGFPAFLYMTTLSLSFMAAIDWVQATEAFSYLEIAKAAPLFPTELLPYHFAQRWVPHYLVSMLASLSGLSIGHV
jgi:hypothetical protein